METILLSIAVWLTHFLTVSSLYFNTPPPSTMRSFTETIFITEETTEISQELGIPLKSTDLSPMVTTTQDSTMTIALTIETQTHASLTQNVTPTEETTSVGPESENNTIDAVKTAEGETNTVTIHTNTSLTATATSFARLTAQMEDKNGTGRGASAHNTSYNNDIWNATTVKQLTSEPFNSVQTVAWTEWTVNDTMKADEENDEMSSTQETFANSDKDSSTTGSNGLTTRHMVLMHPEEHYTTPNITQNTTDATSATIGNIWITSQNTDTPITGDYTTSDGMNITDAPENQSLTPNIKSGRRGEDIEVNESTTQNRVTNFTAQTRKKITTPLVILDTSSGTTNNNKSSIIANVTPDNNTNGTLVITDPKNSLLPECFITSSKQTQQSKLVCFITLWTLAMVASLFLGIIIFLYVRLSILKKRVRIRGGGQEEKGGQKEEKESLWADPKASVQERVEFWYVNGSTLEADRKERGKRREERVKGKKVEQNRCESELWIQPVVTEDDITEFWHANRRMKEDRTQMRYF